MLNLNKNGLEIFENFQIDRNLPKYKASSDINILPFGGSSQALVFSNDITAGGWTTIPSNDGSVDNSIELFSTKQDTFREWLGRKLKRMGDRMSGYTEKEPNSEGKIPTITIEEFFKHIKNSRKEMDRLDKRLEGYEAALTQAEELGQTALKEKLSKQIDVIRSESQLFAKKMLTVITEEQIVQFYKECERGLRLDWIKNFTRQIPSKFIDVKRELDELKVFDNYVILHYDPNAEAYAETQEEIEKKKDPILFGVLQNSKKLYYIGDWVDEVCDLTLDILMDKYGKDAIKQNDIKANIHVQ